MAFTTLIDTATLSRFLDDPAFAIVDCRFKLEDEGWGARAYADAHVPGSVHTSLDRDLSASKTGTNGRHPLPEPSALIRTFERLGIGDDTQVVAYDQDAGMYASRLWWLLRWLGHTEAAVLDGGFAKWVAEGRPTVAGTAPLAARPPRTFSGSPRSDMAVDVSEVTRLMHNPEWRLLDARAPERYRGEVEPVDRVPGHIPGATNHFYRRNLDAQGTLLPPEELRERLQDSIAGVRPDRVVCYCGSGVTACHNLLALEHAGMTGAKLYAGSWSEWSSGPSRPVESQ
jgi:thiosulfate/3-mercaptopyruvate sulfurtransferase